MAALEPGSYCFVSYENDSLFHERLVIGWVFGADYIVISPDQGVFIEVLDASNEGLSAIRICPFGDDFPHGLGGAALYRFESRPVGSALMGLLREGELHVCTERLAWGLAGPADRGSPLAG